MSGSSDSCWCGRQGGVEAIAAQSSGGEGQIQRQTLWRNNQLEKEKSGFILTPPSSGVYVL